VRKAPRAVSDLHSKEGPSSLDSGSFDPFDPFDPLSNDEEFSLATRRETARRRPHHTRDDPAGS